MFAKYALFAIGFTAFAAPAFAANEFYVVQDTATKRCSIVEQKPTSTTMVQVGSANYKTQAEAMSAMNAATGCAK